jgi:cell division protein ZapA
MKQLEVLIMGQNYVLGCPENSEARLLEAVNTVDTSMCKIRDAGKVKARDRIAVLAALNLAYALQEPVPAQAPQHAADQASEAAAQADHATDARLDNLLRRLQTALAGESLAN